MLQYLRKDLKGLHPQWNGAMAEVMERSQDALWEMLSPGNLYHKRPILSMTKGQTP